MVLAVPDSFAGRWWAVHTKPRQEKALASDLGKLEVHCFLPLARVRRRSGGRTVETQHPLFPGYLFMCGNEEERLAALRTHRIVRVLDVGDQEGLRDSLRHIHRLVTSGQPVDPYPGIKPGRRYHVTSGPLRGLEGTVLRRNGISRIYVAVEMFGQSVEAEIDAALLELVD